MNYIKCCIQTQTTNTDTTGTDSGAIVPEDPNEFIIKLNTEFTITKIKLNKK
jgi:hypothetical protein